MIMGQGHTDVIVLLVGLVTGVKKTVGVIAIYNRKYM